MSDGSSPGNTNSRSFTASLSSPFRGFLARRESASNVFRGSNTSSSTQTLNNGASPAPKLPGGFADYEHEPEIDDTDSAGEEAEEEEEESSTTGGTATPSNVASSREPSPARIKTAAATTPSLVNPSVLAAASKLLQDTDDLPPTPSSPTKAPSTTSQASDLEIDILHPNGTTISTNPAAFRNHMILALERIERRMAAIEDDIKTERNRLDRFVSMSQLQMQNLARSPSPSPVDGVSPGGTSLIQRKPILQTGMALILHLIWSGIGKLLKQIAFFVYLRRLRKVLVVVLFRGTMWAQGALPEGLYKYVISPVMDFVFRVI